MEKTFLPFMSELKPLQGLWNKLPPLEREIIAVLRANYYVRDGSRQADGSAGTIQITPRELLDLLAMVYAFGAGLKIATETRSKAEKIAEASR